MLAKINPNITKDYTSFGTALYNRGFTFSNYRYGYQGSEKDNEIKGDGNSYSTEYRILDTRIARWLSIDPELRGHAWLSPYASMNNNPIWLNDIRGNVADKDGDNKNGPEDKPIDKGEEIEVSKGNEDNPFKNDPIHGNTMLPSNSNGGGGGFTQIQTSVTTECSETDSYIVKALGGTSTKQYLSASETIKSVGYKYSQDGQQITIVTNTTTTTVDLKTQIATVVNSTETSTFNVTTGHQITGLSSSSYYEYQTTGTVVSSSKTSNTSTKLVTQTSSLLQERVARSRSTNEKVLNDAENSVLENMRQDQFDNNVRSAKADSKTESKVNHLDPPH